MVFEYRLMFVGEVQEKRGSEGGRGERKKGGENEGRGARRNAAPCAVAVADRLVEVVPQPESGLKRPWSI